MTREVREDVVSTIRIALDHIDLSILSYDICYIPLIQVQPFEELNLASLINSQVSSYAAHSYKEQMDTQALNMELTNQHQILDHNKEERRSSMADVAKMTQLVRRSFLYLRDAVDSVDGPNNDHLGQLKNNLNKKKQ